MIVVFAQPDRDEGLQLTMRFPVCNRYGPSMQSRLLVVEFWTGSLGYRVLQTVPPVWRYLHIKAGIAATASA
ncbi:MAG: hypothetical protein WBM68_00835 [Woeseia sp.]